jgi:hypothetical protein
MIINWAQRVNEKVYRKNFDAIDWRHTPNEQAGSVPRQLDVRQSSHRKNLDSPAQVKPQAVSSVVSLVGSGAIPESEDEQLTTLAEVGWQDARKSLHQIYNETVSKQQTANSKQQTANSKQQTANSKQ